MLLPGKESQLRCFRSQWLHVITTDRYHLLSSIAQKERSKVREQPKNEASNEKMLLLQRNQKLCVDLIRKKLKAMQLTPITFRLFVNYESYHLLIIPATKIFSFLTFRPSLIRGCTRCFSDTTCRPFSHFLYVLLPPPPCLEVLVLNSGPTQW